jgi:hypothetical protein
VIYAKSVSQTQIYKEQFILINGTAGPRPVIEKPKNLSLVWTGPASQYSLKHKLKDAFGSVTELAVEKTGKKACVRPDTISTLQGCLDCVEKACGFCFALGVCNPTGTFT